MLDQLYDATVVMARAKLPDTVAELAPAEGRTWRESDFDCWDLVVWGVAEEEQRKHQEMTGSRMALNSWDFTGSGTNFIDAIHRLRKTRNFTFSYPDLSASAFSPHTMSALRDLHGEAVTASAGSACHPPAKRCSDVQPLAAKPPIPGTPIAAPVPDFLHVMRASMCGFVVCLLACPDQGTLLVYTASSFTS